MPSEPYELQARTFGTGKAPVGNTSVVNNDIAILRRYVATIKNQNNRQFACIGGRGTPALKTRSYCGGKVKNWCDFVAQLRTATI